MKLWVVGRDNEATWDIQAICDSEQLAFSLCPDASYFIGPMLLNVPLTHETIAWSEAYRPCELKGRRPI